MDRIDLTRETKIIYHIDDEETPYLVRLAIPADSVTLGDFKNSLKLPKANYKFFFKVPDDDFGIVKEEIADDSARLPIYKGRVVSYVVSADDSNASDETSSKITEISGMPHNGHRGHARVGAIG